MLILSGISDHRLIMLLLVVFAFKVLVVQGIYRTR